MVTARVGSLFAGYGGLDLGLSQVLDAEVAWVSEIEPAPSRILAHHYPDVPNHGDITTIDWAQVEPIDVLTGGFPCQDVSAAGKRAGLRAGTRTGLWSHMAEAIDQLRPRLVVAENVRGLLSAEADSPVERCPWCVGDGPASGLRALGAVLGDLADIGYDASWCGLRAADVGAPHGRYRIFVVAWPADAEGDPWRLGDGDGWVAADAGGEARVGRPGLRESGPRRLGWGRPTHGRTSAAAADTGRYPRSEDNPDGTATPRRRGEPSTDADVERLARAESPAHERRSKADDPERRSDAAADADSNAVREQPVSERRCCGAPQPGQSRADAPADAAGDGRDEGRPEPAGLEWGCDAAECGASAADAGREHGERWPGAVTGSTHARRPSGESERSTETAADADGDGLEGVGCLRSVGRDADGRDGAREEIAWGAYEPAIRRWERDLGRVAPPPTEPGRTGAPRLSPRFVEWMQGLPDGWVTDVPGISRNDQLKALGNGVLPQQATEALLRLLDPDEAVSAA